MNKHESILTIEYEDRITLSPKQIITKIIDEYRDNPVSSLRTFYKQNPYISQSRFARYIRNKFSMAVIDYLCDVGILVSSQDSNYPVDLSAEDELQAIEELLLLRYKKNPAKSLMQIRDENPDVSFSKINPLAKTVYNQTAKERLVDIGVIMPEELVSPKDPRTTMEKLDEVKAILKERYKTKEKAKTLKELFSDNSDINLNSVNYWTRELYDITAKEFYVRIGVMEDTTESNTRSEGKNSNKGNENHRFEDMEPTSLQLLDQTVSCNSWVQLYISFVNILIKKFPEIIWNLNASSFMDNSNSIDICKLAKVHRLRAPIEIAHGYYLETDYPTTELIQRMKALLIHCGLDFKQCKIRYNLKIGNNPIRTYKTNLSQHEEKDSSKEENTAVNIEKGAKRKYIRNDKEKFYRWMLEELHLSQATCRSYVSALRTAEKYADEHSLGNIKLLGGTKEEVLSAINILFSDPEFVEINEYQHNRFSTSFKKMLEMLEVLESKSTYGNKKNDQKYDKIVAVLQEHYKYGFKYESIREIMRFRQFAEEMRISLPERDDVLRSQILSSGTLIGDKVYCKSDNMPQELQRMVEEAFSVGARVIYYENLFKCEQEWMSSNVITSSDMLKQYLQKSIKGWYFAKKFMVKGDKCTEKDAVSDEMKRVWGQNQFISVNSLHEKLPFIPLGIIWRVISGNNSFAHVSDGEYLLIDRFRITEDEKKNIINYVEETCKEKSFASLSDVPLGNIEEENYELTKSSIYSAIYKSVLSDKYYLNGKILTKNKSEMDAVALLKHYIKDKGKCTFDEIASKVVDLTGSANRQYAFQALYDDMIRIDKDQYVSEALVSFPIDEIDSVLADFITDGFRAIREITTFAKFPLCGQNWNHYLLESFCYRYSRRYRLHVRYFNDKNAGIIADKDINMEYTEMLAVALARADLELTTDNAGRYLYDIGYSAKRKYARIGDIVARARELRKER